MSTKTTSVDLMDVSVEEYERNLDQWLRGFRGMNLARWKILKNAFISVLVFLLAWQAGADPTAALAVIALVNGVSLAELATIWSGAPPAESTQQNNQSETETEAKKR